MQISNENSARDAYIFTNKAYIFGIRIKYCNKFYIMC